MRHKADAKTNAPDASAQETRRPYNIKPVVCPSKDVEEELDCWAAQEFFRVEALLRSRLVMKLYQADKAACNLTHLRKKKYFTEPYIYLAPEDAKNDSLHKQYKVAGGWLVLRGFHHPYLSLKQTGNLLGLRPVLSECVQNVTDDLVTGLKLEREKFQLMLKLTTSLIGADTEQDQGKRFLWLRLDAAFPTHTILKLLKPKLMAMHKALGSVAWEQIGPVVFNPGMRPLIRGYTGLKKWFDCLTCYDLRTATPTLSYGDIAKQVYGTNTPRTYERSEQSYKRFKQLIAAAESDRWPPKGIK